MKTIIALGGNAILKKGQKPTIEGQLFNVKKAVDAMLPIIKKNEVVITHGNGPQVGYLLLQQKGVGLDVIDAETEGQIGYLIQQNLQNLLRKNSLSRGVATILTQVLVSKEDEAFKNPTKFIGPFYRTHREGFKMKKDPRGGWRRVVPSPRPIKIIESDIINKLIWGGTIVIAAGGGGIPVVKEGKKLKGIDAVIDKDLASACLGKSIGAKTLILVTDIDRVYLNYKRKTQKPINKIKLKEIKKHCKEGQFPAGNMGPKIMAAINFLEGKGKKVIITDIKNLRKAIDGKGGTIIRR